jgi:ornithine cyclodeaminase/alanine dehydrogenase-like protein (mu-crystallin family)
MTQPLYLTEADVARLVTVEDAIAVLEAAFALWRDPGTTNLPRQRAKLSGGTFNLLGAACDKKGIFGLKAYFGGKGGARYHVLLYAADGNLLAMIEADLLGALRTGAASGLATKLMANQNARRSARCERSSASGCTAARASIAPRLLSRWPTSLVSRPSRWATARPVSRTPMWW